MTCSDQRKISKVSSYGRVTAGGKDRGQLPQCGALKSRRGLEVADDVGYSRVVAPTCVSLQPTRVVLNLICAV